MGDGGRGGIGGVLTIKTSPGAWDASHRYMVLALAAAALISWWLLWAVFHLAGGIIHLLLAAGLITLVWRVVASSDLRTLD